LLLFLLVTASLFLLKDWLQWTGMDCSEFKKKKKKVVHFGFSLITLFCFYFLFRKEGCDSKPGELYIQVSRDNGAHHSPRWPHAAPGALH
jgi:hypothetical protein